MDVEQQVDDVRLDADHQRLDYDELDTQREDWLLRTESLQWTRPRRIIREYQRCPEYEEIFSTDQVSETSKFGNRTQKGLVKSDGLDRIYPEHRTRVLATARITECNVLVMTGRSKSQTNRRTHRAGDRFAPSSYEEEVVRQTEHRWDTPRKHALFGSDEPDSTTSGSDVVETQDFGLPRDGYAMGAQSGLFIENDSPETARSPSKKLEDTVTQLQRDIVDYRLELRFDGGQGPANPPRPTKRSGFTSTPVPRYSGKSSWEQYRQVFAAIVCSNGWDGATAALQLSHLDGDALNVALLMPESLRVIPGVLMNSLSEHYGSPGRLAEYKRQFRRAFRRPDDDPSIFAVELETLARKAFSDIDSSIQLQMLRDRFIDGQAECALRQHLDSFGPNTPMQNIVDSCRVWESHNEAGARRHDGSGRNPPRAVYQVTEESQSPAESTESEMLDEIMRRLLPTRRCHIRRRLLFLR